MLSYGVIGQAQAAYGSDVVVQADTLETRNLNEVVVTGQSARKRLDNPQIGAENLELHQLSLTPSFAGENDILKSLALLPGVRSENDGGGGFEVRGGTATQNLVMLDGIPLYNPSHVMGIFSTFNDQAIGQATLYKGPFPTSFGGATASVLDVDLSAGDMVSYHAAGTIGILAAKIQAEGPIVKDKLSFSVAGRRSYVDAFLKMVPKYLGTVMNFYDVSAKLRFRPSASHLIDGSFFISHDNMAIHNVMGMYWGNLGASLRWYARISDPLSSTLTVALDRFNPRMGMEVMQMNEEMREYIHTYAVNDQFDWNISDNHTIDFGLRSQLLKVQSGEWTANGAHEREMRSVWENAIWMNYDGKYFGKLEVNGGVRLNATSVLSSPLFHDFIAVGQPSPDFKGKTYLNIEPRISLKVNLMENHALKAGFGMASQNLHSIRSSMTSFPFDRYALTSFEVKPELTYHYGFGYTGMTPSGDFDWSAETFYRAIDNVYDYLDGKTSFSDINLQSLIAGGRGRSYGLELMIRKNTGRLTGWISYTLSQSQTKVAGINGGRWYNSTNDRRHDFSIVAIFRLSKRLILSGTWIFLSGQPLTAPDVKYEVSGVTCYYYSKRNSYKTPPTHRLDLSATYSHAGKKLTYEWTFGLYNTYCRYNPYVIYFQDDPSKPSGTLAVLQAMYGLIPSVSYTLKF